MGLLALVVLIHRHFDSAFLRHFDHPRPLVHILRRARREVTRNHELLGTGRHWLRVGVGRLGAGGLTPIIILLAFIFQSTSS